jgi:hypothetical protein
MTMRWINDPIKGRVLVPEWAADMIECEAKNRGFGLDARDRAAFSNIHAGAPADSTVRVVGAVEAVEVERPKPSNWVEPLPLKTPYVDHVDRIAEAFARREKEEALRQRIKELTEEHERLLAVVRDKGKTK